MIFKTIRTDFNQPDFQNLVAELNAYLKILDGDEHAFYNQFNNIDVLQHVVVCYHNDVAVGCGAIKHFDNESMEVKRMYVVKEFRRKGVAQTVLKSLEIWAKELGYTSCVLETGKRQVDAIKFYQKSGYSQIPNYGQYQDMENSSCFKKQWV